MSQAPAASPEVEGYVPAPRCGYGYAHRRSQGFAAQVLVACPRPVGLKVGVIEELDVGSLVHGDDHNGTVHQMPQIFMQEVHLACFRLDVLLPARCDKALPAADFDFWLVRPSLRTLEAAFAAFAPVRRGFILILLLLRIAGRKSRQKVDMPRST